MAVSFPELETGAEGEEMDPFSSIADGGENSLVISFWTLLISGISGIGEVLSSSIEGVGRGVFIISSGGMIAGVVWITDDRPPSPSGRDGAETSLITSGVDAASGAILSTTPSCSIV